MTEQSEHLSNAQIENYGIRTSGAGPDAAQRDEPQRANHQSIDDQRINDQSISDQRVEAHLADCAFCRNRLFGFHRSLFTGVADSPEADPSGNDTLPSDYSPADQRSADSKVEGSRPTDSALADSNFANPNDPVDPQVRTAPTPECPSTEALRELAAGLTPGDQAPALTRHAATCDHCGPLLRTFTEDFSDDSSPEEQAVLNNLQSSSADWQKNTASEMLAAARASAASAASSAEVGSSATTATIKADEKPSAERPTSSDVGRKTFFWKWVLVPASAAVVAVTAFTIWYVVRDTPEKVEKQLARAYTENRNMEMRVTGALYSPLQPKERGRSTNQSSALFDAKGKILHHLKEQPEDWRWLHQLGVQEMIEGHFDDAIADLEHALQIQPNSTLLMLDLATAHFQRGKAGANSNDYRQAVELLGKVLALDPNNSIALFNRAILYEEMSPPLYDLAAEDWNHYLNLDKDGLWRAEAQRRRSELEQIKKKVR